ncbi:MAG: MBL fold metallo-hydrolase [Anaerolineales bacterium]|nr:MBL fold metallo-hydrolase [Anaerolineales bacterium]
MLLRYFYDDKIAHASYMVGCQANGEALIVDPARDIEPYLQVAEQNGLKIVAATETHIHADFLSGSRELARRTGAKLYLSDEGDENWKYEFTDKFDYQLVKDGDSFKIGNIKIEVIHTPGHTPEHISFLVTDTAGANQPIGIFTGDFVFVGDIGRPDLLEEAAGIKGTAEPGARRMFHSLKRFKALPDHVQVWPAHGAGSACGKALGAVPSSTVGYEKLFNWAMAYEDEDQFVKALLSGQPEAPFYFAMMKKLNKVDRNVLAGLPQPAKLGLVDLQQVLNQGAMVVDTRSADEFAAGHIPGTVNIPLDNSFTNWAGWLLGYEQTFYLLGSETTVRQAVRDLIYIGLDNIGGYFDPSIMDTWPGELQSYATTNPTEIADEILKGEVTVLDIRALSEWNEGHLPGAKHIMLGYLPKRITEIPTDKPVVVHCRTQNRSAIGASVLQAKGIPNVVKLQAGYQGWADAGLPIERNGK